MWLVLSRHDCIFKRDWVSVLQVARLSGLIPHLKLQYRYLHAIGHALEVLMYFQITALSASSLLFIVSMNELCLDVMYRNALFCFRNTCSIIRRALGLSVLNYRHSHIRRLDIHYIATSISNALDKQKDI